MSLNEILENFALRGNERSSVKTVMAESEYAGLSDSNKKRYFPEPIKVSDGVFYLSNQWGSGNIGGLIEAIGKYGIKVEQTSEGASKGKRSVHVKLEGSTSHSCWNSISISREELMEFISEYSHDELDLDSDEGVARASEILNENVMAFEENFECRPDNCDFWYDDCGMTLEVKDGDDCLEFEPDVLASVPVSKETESISQDEFIVIVEVTAKYPSFEADIEIEGEFDVNKLSVVEHAQNWCGKDYYHEDVLYDGEDMCLELTYDRVIMDDDLTLKKIK